MSQFGDNLPQPLPLQQPAQPAFFSEKWSEMLILLPNYKLTYIWKECHVASSTDFSLLITTIWTWLWACSQDLIHPTICPTPISESSLDGMVSMLSGMLLQSGTAMAKVCLGSLDSDWTQCSLVNSIYSRLVFPLFTVVYLRACYNQMVDFWASYLIVELVCWRKK